MVIKMRFVTRKKQQLMAKDVRVTTCKLMTVLALLEKAKKLLFPVTD